jgi:uncharacterized protein YqjF (DUF2071 family)
MHHAFDRVEHRPFPLAPTPRVGRQSWHDLLFVHWPGPAADLAHLVPSSIRIQEFDGTSWVGLVPFHITDLTARWSPAVPWLSAFPEMNLRLYVEHQGRPGVWFVSLDAARWLAVQAARRFAHLPYFHARMQTGARGERVEYVSERRDAPHPVAFDATYWPTALPAEARRGTLEYFLVERYALFTVDHRGRIWTIDIHHHPWPLQTAAAEIRRNTVAGAQQVRPDTGVLLLHFSRRQDVVVWAPRRVGPARAHGSPFPVSR